LSMFRKDAEDRLPLLQSVPTADTLLSFVTHAHALKSASASIGAAEVSARAAELETAGRAGDLAFIAQQLPAFAKQLAELAGGIRSWEISCGGQPRAESPRADKPAALGASDRAAALTLLHELASALKAQKSEDIERILEEFKQQPLDSGAIESMERISDNVLMAEFGSASETVRLLLERLT